MVSIARQLSMLGADRAHVRVLPVAIKCRADARSSVMKMHIFPAVKTLASGEIANDIVKNYFRSSERERQRNAEMSSSASYTCGSNARMLITRQRRVAQVCSLISSLTQRLCP